MDDRRWTITLRPSAVSPIVFFCFLNNSFIETTNQQRDFHIGINDDIDTYCLDVNIDIRVIVKREEKISRREFPQYD